MSKAMIAIRDLKTYQRKGHSVAAGGLERLVFNCSDGKKFKPERSAS